MGLAEGFAAGTAHQEMLLKKEELRRRALNQFGLENQAGVAPLGADALSLSAPIPTPDMNSPLSDPSGVRQPGDDAQFEKLMGMVSGQPQLSSFSAPQPGAGVQAPPPAGVAAMPPIPAGAPPLPQGPRSVLGGPPAAPNGEDVGLPETPPEAPDQSPLAQTRTQLANTFQNFPRLGAQWAQKAFGFTPQEAQAFLTPGAPLPPEVQAKVEATAATLGQNGGQLQVPNLRFGQQTPEFLQEMQLQKDASDLEQAKQRHEGSGKFEDSQEGALFDAMNKTLRAQLTSERDAIKQLIDTGQVEAAKKRRTGLQRAQEQIDLFQAAVAGQTQLPGYKDLAKQYPDIVAYGQRISQKLGAFPGAPAGATLSDAPALAAVAPGLGAPLPPEQVDAYVAHLSPQYQAKVKATVVSLRQQKMPEAQIMQLLQSSRAVKR